MATAKVTLNNVVLIDATPATAAAADIIAPKTAMLANGVVTQGTGGSTTFVVTVSYNDSTENWEPTCTFAQIADAYAAGKTILVSTDSADAAADGWYIYDSPGDEWLEYLVEERYTDAGVSKIYFQRFVYNENELRRLETAAYLYPDGTYTVSASGTFNIAKYASVSVPAGTAGTPTAIKSAVSNHSVSVTPSVANQTGWITGSTKDGTAVTVTAAELESGTLQITENDTGISVSGYSAVDVAVPDSNFVVTIGWDDVNELWLPDKTLAEIEEAYLQNVPIVTTSIDQQSVMVTGNCFQDIYSYYVFDGTTLTAYVLQDNGLARVGYTYDLYDTSDATISSNSQLLNGIKAIGADGTVYTGNIPSKSSSDLTASGATVTVPAGYYANQATKSVTTGTATAPASISGSSATVSTGTNTLTLTKTVSVTPNVTTAGYVSAGTAGNSSVSLTASVTTRAAGTITPTKSTQTIPSGTYLTGTQTIAAIPAAYQDVTGVTATASDVISGKDIVNSSGTVVHGSLVVQNYYTGSTEPSSSLGSNGDLYFQTE